jgi:hypothetical protein
MKESLREGYGPELLTLKPFSVVCFLVMIPSGLFFENLLNSYFREGPTKEDKGIDFTPTQFIYFHDNSF